VKRLVGISVAVLLLASCGTHTETLDQQRLEAKIKAWAVKQSGPNTQVKVSCPADIPIKPGTDFHCLVSDQHGTSIRLTVTIENDQGYVTWTTS
jgi:hypothetical protein